MASINKLSIRGVRSFSPEDVEQVLEFYFPCTIILGANGCGKTTIIESLKYAVTGAFPPGNKSGQAFVHDPRSVGHSQVKANVKLRLTTRAGQVMVVVRSMEVTQTKSKLTFKQLDGAIRTQDSDGQRVTLSHKCTELDKQLPALLGVSKAVLEHVVFCHQEESSWPLMEGAVLKKRFDDIFDSTRYSKALEIFRKTEKDFLAKAKDHKIDQVGLASHLHAAKGFHKGLDELNVVVEGLDDKKKELNDHVKQIQEDLERANDIIRQMEKADLEIESLKIKKDQLIHVMQNQRSMLEEDMTDKYTEQQLRDLISDFDNKMQDQIQEKISVEDQYAAVNLKIESLRQQEIDLTSYRGKLAAEKETHEKRVKERFELMERIAQVFQVDLQSSQLDGSVGPYSTTQSQSLSQVSIMTISNDDMRVFLQALDKKETAMAKELEEEKKKGQKEEDDLQLELSKLGGDLQSLENDLRKLTSQRDAHKHEMDGIARKLSNPSKLRQGDIDESRRQVGILVRERDEASNDPRRSEIPVLIRQCEMKIDELQRQLDDDKKEQGTLRNYQDIQNSVSLLSEQYVKDIEAVNDSIEDNQATFQLLGIPPPSQFLPNMEDASNTVLPAIEVVCDNLQTKFNAAESSRKLAVSKLNSTQQLYTETLANLNANKQKLVSIKQSMARIDGAGGSLSKYKDVIKEVNQLESEAKRQCNLPEDKPQEVVAYLNERLDAVDKSASVVITPDVVAKVVKRLKKMVKKKVGDNVEFTCPCCRREMQENSVLEVFIDATSELASDPRLIDDRSNEKIALLREFYSERRKVIQGLTMDILNYYRMAGEITSIEETVEALAKDVINLKDQLRESNENLELANRASDGTRDLLLSSKRWLEDTAKLDCKRHEIGQKKFDLQLRVGDYDRDLKAVDKDIALRSNEKDKLAKDMNSLNKEMSEINNRISKLSTQAFLKEKQTKEMEDQFVEGQKATTRKSELVSIFKKIQEEENELLNSRAPLQQKARAKEQEKKGLRLRLEQDIKRLSDLLIEYRSSVRQLQELNDLISSYIASDKPQESSDIESKVRRVVIEVNELKGTAETLRTELNSLSAKVSDQERQKQQINMNLEIMARDKAITKLDSNISKLESERGKIAGSERAFDDFTTGQERKESLLADKARVEGRWTEVVEQIRSLKRKLSSPEYKDVEERHRIALIRVETTLIAAEDLKKYGNALDKAILKFHSVKIKEINKIIRELWLLTYKGEDITNIEIVSGQEAGSRASKSYNYRVVMSKGSTQLDMRGRCSAGQRVLASIVIRLALAETFCVNLGCIALDEPTVNLDESNKRGLAIALAQIVASRSSQRNFQLILITHDEDFVTMMKRELSSLTGFSLPDKYFEVTRELAPDGKYYSKINAIDWEQLP